MAYLAHMKGILGKSARVDYTPNSATGDEMRLSEMTMAGSDRTDTPSPSSAKEPATCSPSSGAGCTPAHCH